MFFMVELLVSFRARILRGLHNDFYGALQEKTSCFIRAPKRLYTLILPLKAVIF